MEPNPDRKVTVSLRCTTLPTCPDGLTPASCLICEAPLDIHQPDAELPDRMLGTCEACKAWFLIDCGNEVVLALLPDAAPFRKAPGR